MTLVGNDLQLKSLPVDLKIVKIKNIMRIATDLDEVIANFLAGFTNFYNDKYGTDLNESDFFSYDFWKVTGGTKNETIEEIYDFYKSEYFKNIKPVEGAIEGLERLNRENELFLITSRQDDVMTETEEWIERHLPNTFTGIYNTNEHSENGFPVGKKSNICDKLDVDVMIEDSPAYAAECAESGRRVILMERPWNRDSKIPEGVRTVSGWEEIMEIYKKGEL
jgi:uncharacterized HAD superfamily protein